MNIDHKTQVLTYLLQRKFFHFIYIDYKELKGKKIYSNMTSFFRFVNKQASYPFG